mmetsp:Transcript_14924/g.39671  ORF Transcript_14924/g.39671 Transcript_14924/m.39671 type:complete len:259 (+) Transcript_14924:351-1127(+)
MMSETLSRLLRYFGLRCSLRHNEYMPFSRAVMQSCTPASCIVRSCSNRSFRSLAATSRVSLCCARLLANTLSIRSNSSGKRCLNERSSSSVLNSHTPRRWASGTNTAIVSDDILALFSAGMKSSVLMLCNLSANLTMMTLQSSAIAKNMSRKLYACSRAFAASAEEAVPCCLAPKTNLHAGWYSALQASSDRITAVRLDALVSPSTILRTSWPNSSSRSSNCISWLSSTVSCRSPAITTSALSRREASNSATATGCTM